MTAPLPITAAAPNGFAGASFRAASEGGNAAASSSFAASLREVEANQGLDTARDAAQQIVATALVQPVLAMLRESNMAEGPFAPGDAERRFGPLLEQQIADRITRRASFPLVEKIAQQLHAGSKRATSGDSRPASSSNEGRSA